MRNTLFFLVAGVICLRTGVAFAEDNGDLIRQPYLLDTGLASRSISFENPTGAPGEGGKAASNLGPGRKGAPCRTIKPAETVQLCDIQGPGTIRHIWLTTERNPLNLRSCVLRAYLEGQEQPSIECPVGDFFGFAHGKVLPYCSAVHSVSATAGMNLWLPMPFVTRFKMSFTNEGEKAVPLFYQVDYTTGDKHPADVGRLHVLFRRENPTTEKKDFELLPERKSKGRFIGSVLGVRNLHEKQWWGEGEIKVYMDGDTAFPTICGTGSEDYIGQAWGVQQATFLYNGCSLNQKNYVSAYRWHLPDAIAWQKQCRITIQQIAYLNGLAETQDDWCCATFWYEPVPSAPLPQLPDVKARTADIWKE
ncbi:MAG: glycoside hydrolase family 172 protein [Planctomycetota bacterium]